MAHIAVICPECFAVWDYLYDGFTDQCPDCLFGGVVYDLSYIDHVQSTLYVEYLLTYDQTRANMLRRLENLLEERDGTVSDIQGQQTR